MRAILFRVAVNSGVLLREELLIRTRSTGSEPPESSFAAERMRGLACWAEMGPHPVVRRPPITRATLATFRRKNQTDQSRS